MATNATDLGPVGRRLRERLEAEFTPERLEVRDDSHKHEGHAGWRPEGETHFHVTMASAAFAGKSRVERQRMVHRALADELAERVHALSLTLTAPDEA